MIMGDNPELITDDENGENNDSSDRDDKNKQINKQ